MRSIAVVILSALVAAFGAACMGDDEDEQSRRPAALGDPSDPGEGEPAPPIDQAPPPTVARPAPPAPVGWENLYQFRGTTILAQPIGGVRVAIAGTLPPGRYVLLAKVQMNSVVVPSTPWTVATNAVNLCELRGDTDKIDDVVLDWNYTTLTFPGVDTMALFATHEVTSSGEVKVVCRQGGLAGAIGSRLLTALKVE